MAGLETDSDQATIVVIKIGLPDASTVIKVGRRLGRSGARVASIRGGSRGGVSEDGRDAAAEAASYRFGASRRGEWLLSLPLPLAALEARGGDDSLRVEFSVGEARAELCEG